MRARAIALLGTALLAAGAARAAYEDLGAGARAPGMGGAFAAVADDVYALHYNPAGLAQLTRPELGTSYTKMLLGLTDNSDLGVMFLGYAHPLRGGRAGTLAGSWEQFALNSSLYKEQSFSLAYARPLAAELGPGRLLGGVSAKYLRRAFGSFPEASNSLDGIAATGQPDPVLSGRNAVGAFDADAGLLYRLRQHYSAALTLKHIPQPDVAFSAADSDRVPLAVAAALNYGSILSNLGVQYETVRSPVGTRDHNLAFAVERWFPRLLVGEFGLRGAMNLGSRGYRQVNTGLSYRTGRVTVDYAFGIPIAGIAATAGSHRLAISLRFGSLAEPDESVVMILEAMRQLKRGTVPELRALGLGLTPEQKALLDEYLALAKSLQSQARYQEALARLGQALGVSPGDTELLKTFGRLNWVAQQIKSLPDYKSDPVEASWHRGVSAYLAGDDPGAIRHVAEALEFGPERKALDGFLAQLELATGLKRPEIQRATPQRLLIEQLLAQAGTAVAEGRYDEAIALSRRVLELDAEALAAWENLGTSLFALGDYANSLEAWERAYALEQSAARRTALKGYIKSLRALLARPKPAAPAVAAAPEPARTPAWRMTPLAIQKLYDEGVDHYTAGRLKDAQGAFETVLQADPAYVPARKALRRVMEEVARQ